MIRCDTIRYDIDLPCTLCSLKVVSEHPKWVTMNNAVQLSVFIEKPDENPWFNLFSFVTVLCTGIKLSLIMLLRPIAEGSRKQTTARMLPCGVPP